MAELRTSILVNLAGNLERRAAQFQASLARLGSAGTKYLQGGIGGAADMAGRAISAAGSKWAALGVTAATVALARQTMALDARLERLGIAANSTSAEVRGLWAEINRAATLPDIRLDPKEMLSAVEEIMERTGDLEFVRANIENIGRGIQGTGAGGAAMGGMLSELQKMGIRKPDEVAAAMDKFNAKGKAGAFTFGQLAALGPRVVAAYSATGRGGLEAIDEMASSLQVIRQGTGSAEQTVTAFEAILRTLSDAQKLKLLQEKGGIKVFDTGALKEGREIMRPLPDLMEEIVKAAQGRKTLLTEVFDAEAMRALNVPVSEFLRTGEVSSLRRFMGIQGPGQTAQDSARMAATASAQTGSNVAQLQKKVTDAMSEPVQHVAEAGVAVLEGRFRDAASGAMRAYSSTFGGLMEGLLEMQRASSRRAAAERDLEFAESRLRAEMEGRPLPGRARRADGLIPPRSAANRWLDSVFTGEAFRAPEGKVVIEVKAAPGTSADVRKLESRNMTLDVDRGLIMGP
jgi:hypothetical protein